MTLEEIKTKIDRGEMLTPDEQKELFALVGADFEKLKQEDPAKYLELIKAITKVVTGLNEELREAKEQLKA